MDRFGRGSYLWTATPETGDNTALIQVTANHPASPTDTSDDAFLIANAGSDYFVNDREAADDEYTTALGDNTNSGKNADAPMASLRGLLAAYDLDAGDTVFVDTGSYAVRQERLEKANVNGMREMMEMLSVLRAYEANQRVISYQDELEGKVANDLATVR